MTANIRALRRPSTGPGRRMKVDWQAKCGTAVELAPCRILDISPDGARIHGAVESSDDDGVLLCLQHGVPVRATIVWRNRDCIGLSFSEQQSWIQRNIANRFDAAAWLR